MKIKDLRQIIREEIKSVLSENQPKPAPPRETPGREIADPDTDTDKDKGKKRRTIGNPDVQPAPKNKTKATIKDADIISKITQRFKTLKKKSLSEIKVKNPLELKKAMEDYVKAEQSIKGQWDVPANTEIAKAEEIKSKAREIFKSSNLSKEQIAKELEATRKQLKKKK